VGLICHSSIFSIFWEADGNLNQIPGRDHIAQAMLLYQLPENKKA
jgi:hypothetical protein